MTKLYNVFKYDAFTTLGKQLIVVCRLRAESQDEAESIVKGQFHIPRKRLRASRVI